MSLQELLEDLIAFIIKWTIIILIIVFALIIIGAIFLEPIGLFIKGGLNNTLIKTIGLSDAVNITGSSLISFGGTLRWYLIILGLLAIVVIICIVLIYNWRRKKRGKSCYEYEDTF